jgi:GNAT superfamily N-acetyltransferase
MNAQVYSFIASLLRLALVSCLWLDGPVNAAVLRGVKVDLKDPFSLVFVVSGFDESVSSDKIKETSLRLIEYFLAALTLPEEDLWVNLSPYEPGRIIPEGLSVTGLGKVLLEQDYALKCFASRLTHPDSEIGRAYWKACGERMSGERGMDLSKIWIVPSNVTIYEDCDSAYLTDLEFEVRTETDYAAFKAEGGTEGAATSIILPRLREEVNSGEDFLSLREATSAVMLAAWFKLRLKECVLNRVYADSKKIRGIDVVDPSRVDDIYGKYVEIFTRGVFDILKKERDRVSGRLVKRRYFSGGISPCSFVDSKTGCAVVASAVLSEKIRPFAQAIPEFYRLLNAGTYDVSVRLEPMRMVSKMPAAELKTAVGEEAGLLFERWFGAGENRYFARALWEGACKDRSAKLTYLQGPAGELVGMAVSHVVDHFLLPDSRVLRNIRVCDLFEVAEAWRGKNIGRALMSGLLRSVIEGDPVGPDGQELLAFHLVEDNPSSEDFYYSIGAREIVSIDAAEWNDDDFDEDNGRRIFTVSRAAGQRLIGRTAASALTINVLETVESSPVGGISLEASGMSAVGSFSHQWEVSDASRSEEVGGMTFSISDVSRSLPMQRPSQTAVFHSLKPSRQLEK